MEIPVHFEKTGEERRLAPETELALYRMVQESLNNIARHSQATQAWVQVAFYPEGLVVSVRDNGNGFRMPETTADFAQAGHFGLLGLYERADLIQADLTLESSPGNGTKVIITVQANSAR